jgi:hypothetical protein
LGDDICAKAIADRPVTKTKREDVRMTVSFADYSSRGTATFRRPPFTIVIPRSEATRNLLSLATPTRQATADSSLRFGMTSREEYAAAPILISSETAAGKLYRGCCPTGSATAAQ